MVTDPPETVTLSGDGALQPRKFRRAPGGLTKFHTIEAVAEALDVSTRTVRRWIDRRKLIEHRFGRAVRISDADLRAFIALHREG